MPQTYVALDLETTGLDTENDSIIEVGAVRFTLDGKIDEYTTLVNPGKPLAPIILRLTGITDRELATAPPIEAVASDIEQFLAGSILVGHNACGFDAPMLDAHRIQRPLGVYDTQQIAEVLMPSAGHFGLADLTASLSIAFEGHHRAMADAEASRQLFLALIEKALDLPGETLSQIGQWLTPTALPWRGFFREVWDLRGSRAPNGRPQRARAESSPPVRPSRSADPVSVPVEQSQEILRSANARSDVFEVFEERSQQVQMLSAVSDCLNEGRHLMVEAGTGTGKSLAYLIPAATQAVANGTRVVVSTSTINLQEQLAKKDVPAVQALMGSGAPAACQLKGRRNYLCLRRFQALTLSAPASDEEAKLAARILVWMGETETGDRGEIRLSPDEERLWYRLSADGAECTSDNSPFIVDGSCFLQKARRKAEASHIVVVNHSLLLADAAIGGGVIPPFQHLVVDEAHHLEDEASRQFGFSCRQKELQALPDRCVALARNVVNAVEGPSGLPLLGQQIASAASALREEVKPVRANLQVFYNLLAGFVADHAPPGEEGRLHLKRSARAQAQWSDVEVAWDNASAALRSLAGSLERLAEGLNGIATGGPPNVDLLVSDATGCIDDARYFTSGIQVAVEADDPLRITWLETDRADGGVTVSWVPLDVSGKLQERVFVEGRSIVFTGATLQSGGNFDYIQNRLGVADCEPLALGSPFDYSRQALVVLGTDMPEPNSPSHLDAVGQVVVDLARAARGRTLVLFTSNSALRAVHRLISEDLRREGITVLGQGVDGSARQLVKALQSVPATVILGTASFWEGVDIPGEHLSVLAITRLPFPVPTDPVHAARSEQYEDPFSQYTLPQAVIRFKQGFGRLIRSRTDRGVVAVLDPRISTKRYGEVFLQSLPGCPIRRMPGRQMGSAVEAFLAESSVAL